MKKYPKRLLSALIVLAMALSMLPMISLAAGTTTTVYCYAPDSWTSCYVYWWASPTAETPIFPGVVMVKDANGIWGYDIPSDASGVIFTNGSSKTENLKIPTDDLCMYVVDGSYWSSYGEVLPEVVYYVAGDVSNWIACDPACRMIPQADGTHCLTFAVTAGEHQLKITEGVWDNAVGNPDGSNFTFTSTAGEVTVTFDGTTITVTGDCLTEAIPPVPTGDVQIVDAAYALDEGQSLPGESTLTGVVTSIDTPYNDYYGNITVTMAVAGREHMPIKCYRLSGDGVAALNAGDTITVTGTLTNYYGTIEFAQGCVLENVVKGEGYDIPDDPLLIVDAAYELEIDASLPYIATLTGVVITVDTPYSPDYDNITVTMAVPGREDKPIQCFRLKGEGIDTLTVGDTITVTGSLKNYQGTIEFGYGCKLDELVKGDTVMPELPEDATDDQIVDAAYALPEGTFLPDQYSLTGVITAVNTAYRDDYGNITVTIAVPGQEDKPVLCYRMRGAEIDTLTVGDTITVSGYLHNHYGTVRFDEPCWLDNVIQGPEPEIPEDPQKILEEAYGLEAGSYLPYVATLTGVITSIDTPYDYGYSNLSVTIAVEGCEDKPVFCYRVDGFRAEILAVGDTITVTGSIKNHNGTVQFDQGSSLIIHGVSIGGSFVCGTETEAFTELFLYRQDVMAAGVLFTDRSTDYLFENIPAGAYTITVSKENHVPRTYEVTVGQEDMDFDIQIHLIGDINGDGRVNTGDVSMMYAHAKKSISLEDYEFSCADVNGDGRVNTGDTSRAYAHAKKTSLLW